jgi:hypothetical protein
MVSFNLFCSAVPESIFCLQPAAIAKKSKRVKKNFIGIFIKSEGK